MSLPLFKSVADTSITTFREVIVPTKAKRQQHVLNALARYSNVTSYELFRWMKHMGTATDLNDVRPRLCELLKLGRVERGDKRRCLITGHVAYCWRVK